MKLKGLVNFRYMRLMHLEHSILFYSKHFSEYTLKVTTFNLYANIYLVSHMAHLIMGIMPGTVSRANCPS